MHEIIKYIKFICLALLITGCSTTLLVVTDPIEAEVYVGRIGIKKKTLLGKTPLEIKENDLKKRLNINPKRLEFVEMEIKKKGYETEKAWIPSGRWGRNKTTVKMQLNRGEGSLTYVERLVKHVFNAQKFAETRQFGQAHGELDKSLKISPDFARAMSMKGAVYFLQKRYNDSEIWYKKALDKDPTHSEAIRMLNRIRKIR